MYLFPTLLHLTKQTQTEKIKSFSQNFFTVHHICSNFDALDKKLKIYISAKTNTLKISSRGTYSRQSKPIVDMR